MVKKRIKLNLFLQILLRSDDVSLDDKCMFEDWNYQGIKFKNWSGKKCTPKEKKVFYTNKSDKIFERINGNKSTTWRDYMNLSLIHISGAHET